MSPVPGIFLSTHGEYELASGNRFSHSNLFGVVQGQGTWRQEGTGVKVRASKEEVYQMVNPFKLDGGGAALYRLPGA